MSRAGRRLPALVRIMQLISEIVINQNSNCLLYTSDAADD
mgnify:FL=1